MAVCAGGWTIDEVGAALYQRILAIGNSRQDN